MTIKKIEFNKLKDYIESSKSCIFTSEGCKLQSKLGRVKFDLSSFKGIFNCTIQAKKISGDGKIIVNNDEIINNIVISSKKIYNFDISLNDKQCFEISRPNDSIGEIIITEISFDFIQESLVANNWKELINKCGKYSGLRLVGNRLFASSGGFIENSEIIKNIITDPQNSFKNENNKIIFNKSCEIKNIEIHGKGVEKVREQPFVERKAPIVIKPIILSDKIKSPIIESEPPPITEEYLTNFKSNIIFDSNSVDFGKIVLNKDKNIKIIKNLGKNIILLKKDGQFILPISSLKPNTEYICIIYAKKINGNGKINAYFSSENNQIVKKYLQFTNNVVGKYLTLKTNNSITQKLHINMEGISVGEILINRIVIINNIDINKARIINNLDYLKKPITNNKNLYSSFNNAIILNTDDNVYNNSKKYARYFNESYDIDDSINYNFSITSPAGMSWYQKMIGFYPHLSLSNDGFGIDYAGQIQDSKYIWLDVFKTLSDDDLNKISRKSKIYTPSITNAQFISDKFKNILIENLRKPLPWTEPEKINYFTNLNYVVALNRGKKSISYLIKNWNNNLPKLVLLGVRGNFPDFVIPINEYLSYPKLIYILSKSKFVIDISEFDDYDSSFLALLNAMGIPTLTTNNFVINYSNLKHLSDKNLFNKYINELLDHNHFTETISDYNNQEFSRFKKMFTLD